MVSFIVSVSAVSYLVTNNSIIAELQTTQDVKPGGGLELFSRTLGGCKEERVDIVSRTISKDFNETFCRKIEEGVIVFPVKKREPRLPFNLQQWLIQLFNIGTFSGRFSDSFPELDRVTKVYQELEIGKIAAILEGELERSGERIQFLGLQVPERIIVNWEMVILISVQIYFFVQLWNFFRMSKGIIDQQSRNAGWIGLYPEFLARLTSFVTVGLLPLTTAILISLENWEALSFSTALAALYTRPLVVSIGVVGLGAAFLTLLLSRFRVPP
jgi:hypothetical protein